MENENSWWDRRPFPNSFVWDVVEGVAWVATIWVFWEIAQLGKDDGFDYRYEKRP